MEGKGQRGHKRPPNQSGNFSQPARGKRGDAKRREREAGTHLKVRTQSGR